MSITQPYIPERFQNTVAAHIVMNLIEIPNLQTPLLLGIHGPAGEGKTDQCRWILEEMGIIPDWIFSHEFENENAGIPARNIKDKYKNASAYNLQIRNEYTNYGFSNNKYKLRVLFINDIDQRIGRSDNLIQQTINTQLVNTSLMEIADNPTQIDGMHIARVPVIVTGNNLGCLHAPLRRDGRMEKFEWIPTLDEKSLMLRQIFPEQTLSQNDIKALLRDYGHYGNARSNKKEKLHLSVSSFATIRYCIYRSEITRMIRDIGMANVLDFVLSKKHMSYLHLPVISLESIRNAAEELGREGFLHNHLRS